MTDNSSTKASAAQTPLDQLANVTAYSYSSRTFGPATTVSNYVLLTVSIAIVVSDIIAVRVLRKCRRIPRQCLLLSVNFIVSDGVNSALFALHQIALLMFNFYNDITHFSRMFGTGLMNNITSASITAIAVERVIALKANLRYAKSIRMRIFMCVIVFVWAFHTSVIASTITVSVGLHWTTIAPSATPTPDSVQVVNVVLTLDITVEGNLNVSVTYETYRLEVQARLTIIYIEKLGVVTVTIKINSLSIGSLVVDYDVVVPKTSLPDVAVVHADIASGNTTVQVFGDSVHASGIVIDNTTVDVGVRTTEEQLCEIYEASAGDCGTEYLCSVSNGLPFCELRHTEDTLPLILGLGIGIPMFLLCVAAIILFIVFYHHRIRRKQRGIYRDDDESSSSVYQGRIPVRLYTGARGHFYGPQDLPTFPDKNGYRSDSSEPNTFSEHTMYYDNAPKADQENRFTWDFLLGFTRPGEKYQIRRPMFGREQEGQNKQHH
ncbi:uncharacterized protein LOC123560135 [Mercenaria mercenaria]|uniref:uncharacterized protein LOC123560135 n=1 Tax=Mercenaria mercenaria TaxID=6596 RepID=UPI00234F0C46|nr:uncharacterized protein LOC123560135 [Mercenaria mercenaria]